MSRLKSLVVILLLMIITSISVSASKEEFSITFNGLPMKADSNSVVGTSVILVNNGEAGIYTLRVADVIPGINGIERITAPTENGLGKYVMSSTWIDGFGGEIYLDSGEEVVLPVSISLPAGVNRPYKIALVVGSESGAESSKIFDLVDLGEIEPNEHNIVEVMTATIDEETGSVTGVMRNLTPNSFGGVLTVKLTGSEGTEYTSLVDIETISVSAQTPFKVAFDQKIPKDKYEIETSFTDGEIVLVYQFVDITEGFGSDSSSKSIFKSYWLYIVAVVILILAVMSNIRYKIRVKRHNAEISRRWKGER